MFLFPARVHASSVGRDLGGSRRQRPYGSAVGRGPVAGATHGGAASHRRQVSGGGGHFTGRRLGADRGRAERPPVAAAGRAVGGRPASTGVTDLCRPVSVTGAGVGSVGRLVTVARCDSCARSLLGHSRPPVTCVPGWPGAAGRRRRRPRGCRSGAAAPVAAAAFRAPASPTSPPRALRPAASARRAAAAGCADLHPDAARALPAARATYLARGAGAAPPCADRARPVVTGSLSPARRRTTTTSAAGRCARRALIDLGGLCSPTRAKPSRRTDTRSPRIIERPAHRATHTATRWSATTPATTRPAG